MNFSNVYGKFPPSIKPYDVPIVSKFFLIPSSWPFQFGHSLEKNYPYSATPTAPVNAAKWLRGK